MCYILYSCSFHLKEKFVDILAHAVMPKALHSMEWLPEKMKIVTTIKHDCAITHDSAVYNCELVEKNEMR